MKELKINVPKGYEIDKENSTFECIKFKPIAKRWRDDTKANLTGYYINSYGSILYNASHNIPENYNDFATIKQAKSALAMARISQIMANDKRFGGVITDKEWGNAYVKKYLIVRNNNKIGVSYCATIYYFLAFHTIEQRDLFLKENEDLVKDYLMLE